MEESGRVNKTASGLIYFRMLTVAGIVLVCSLCKFLIEFQMYISENVCHSLAVLVSELSVFVLLCNKEYMFLRVVLGNFC